jgi:hypothetical protein
MRKRFKATSAVASCNFFKSVCLIMVTMLFSCMVHAQEVSSKKDTVAVEDIGDVARRLLHKKVDSSKVAKPGKYAILPSIGFNPSLGALIGAKVAGVKQFGNKEDTKLSFFGLEGLITSKGVITVEARHNIFTEANKWNIQGNWRFSKMYSNDNQCFFLNSNI